MTTSCCAWPRLDVAVRRPVPRQHRAAPPPGAARLLRRRRPARPGPRAGPPRERVVAIARLGLLLLTRRLQGRPVVWVRRLTSSGAIRRDGGERFVARLLQVLAVPRRRRTCRASSAPMAARPADGAAMPCDPRRRRLTRPSSSSASRARGRRCSRPCSRPTRGSTAGPSRASSRATGTSTARQRRGSLDAGGVARARRRLHRLAAQPGPPGRRSSSAWTRGRPRYLARAGRPSLAAMLESLTVLHAQRRRQGALDREDAAPPAHDRHAAAPLAGGAHRAHRARPARRGALAGGHALRQGVGGRQPRARRPGRPRLARRASTADPPGHDAALRGPRHRARARAAARSATSSARPTSRACSTRGRRRPASPAEHEWWKDSVSGPLDDRAAWAAGSARCPPMPSASRRCTWPASCASTATRAPATPSGRSRSCRSPTRVGPAQRAAPARAGAAYASWSSRPSPVDAAGAPRTAGARLPRRPRPARSHAGAAGRQAGRSRRSRLRAGLLVRRLRGRPVTLGPPGHAADRAGTRDPSRCSLALGCCGSSRARSRLEQVGASVPPAIEPADRGSHALDSAERTDRRSRRSVHRHDRRGSRTSPSDPSQSEPPAAAEAHRHRRGRVHRLDLRAPPPGRHARPHHRRGQAHLRRQPRQPGRAWRTTPPRATATASCRRTSPTSRSCGSWPPTATPSSTSPPSRTSTAPSWSRRPSCTPASWASTRCWRRRAPSTSDAPAERPQRGFRFLQVSTDEVYGPVPEGLSVEDDAIRPTSPYSAAKAAGEHLVARLPRDARPGHRHHARRQHLRPAPVPREAHPALHHQRARRRAAADVRRRHAASRLALRGRPCRRHRRRPSTAAPAAAAYNIPGDGVERPNRAVTEAILEALGKPWSLVRSVPDRPGHDRRYALDGSRLRALGWQPARVLRGGHRADRELVRRAT